MSGPSVRLADGIMGSSTLPDGNSVYIFNQPGELSLKSGYKYALLVEGVSQSAYPYWEDVMFDGQIIKTYPLSSDSSYAGGGMFGVKFEQTSDATGAFNGRLNYGTKQQGDAPRLTWILQTFPDPSGVPFSNGTASAGHSNGSLGADSPSTLVASGPLTWTVNKGYATCHMDARSFNLQTGAYAVFIAPVNKSVNTFWEFMTGPGGQITPVPMKQTAPAYGVGINIRLDGPPQGGLQGSLQYDSVTVPANMGWSVYKLN